MGLMICPTCQNLQKYLTLIPSSLCYYQHLDDIVPNRRIAMSIGWRTKYCCSAIDSCCYNNGKIVDGYAIDDDIRLAEIDAIAYVLKIDTTGMCKCRSL